MGRQRAHRLYPRDLTDEAWRVVKPLIPVKMGQGKAREPRTLSMRAVLNALFYLDRTSCQWDYLPHTYPKRSSVRYYYDAWRADGTWELINTALRERIRVAVGKAPEPSAVIIDSQSVKTIEMGGVKGCDACKKIKGASGISLSTRWVCCWWYSFIPPTFKTVMEPVRSSKSSQSC